MRAYVAIDAPRRSGMETVHGLGVVAKVKSASAFDGKKPGD